MADDGVFRTGDDNADNGPNMVEVANQKYDRNDPVTVADAEELAEQHGIKKFQVKDENGNVLKANDFPYDGDVRVVDYNQNAEE